MSHVSYKTADGRYENTRILTTVRFLFISARSDMIGILGENWRA